MIWNSSISIILWGPILDFNLHCSKMNISSGWKIQQYVQYSYIISSNYQQESGLRNNSSINTGKLYKISLIILHNRGKYTSDQQNHQCATSNLSSACNIQITKKSWEARNLLAATPLRETWLMEMAVRVLPWFTPWARRRGWRGWTVSPKHVLKT